MAPTRTAPDREALTAPVLSWSTESAAGSARSARTRRTLLLAAARQIAEHGYHGASLRGILDAAGLTKGALYFHFSSKEDLGRAVVAEAFRSWSDLVDVIHARGLDPLWTLLLETDGVVGRRMYDPIVRAGGRVLQESGLFDEFRVTWAADWIEETTASLGRARHAGLLRPSASPGHLARTLVALMTGHFALAVASGDEGDYFVRMNDMWEGVLPIVATDDWIAGWEASCWRSRPAPERRAFLDARRP